MIKFVTILIIYFKYGKHKKNIFKSRNFMMNHIFELLLAFTKHYSLHLNNVTKHKISMFFYNIILGSDLTKRNSFYLTC